MDELDRLLAETMHDAAGHAPADDRLLTGVQRRSRQLHRRRLATALGLSAAAAVLVVAVPFAVVDSLRPDRIAPQPAASPSATPSSLPSSSPPSSSSSPSSLPSSPPSSSADVVRLQSGWNPPTFPYELPAENNRREPVVSLSDGTLSAFFETTDPDNNSDVTVTVSSRKPSFPTAATETPFTVRGHAGTLRTVDEEPAKLLTLFWRESSSRWIQLATDDTYSADEVVKIAESLRDGAVDVQSPFELALSPAGLAVETVSPSRITFDGVSIVLRKHQQLNGINRKVNGYNASLTPSSLAVDITDWDATLQITITAGRTMTPTDLLRLAAGITILNNSNPE